MNKSHLKKELLSGEVIEFISNNNVFVFWFSSVTKNFCIEKNAIVIHSLRTFDVFFNKFSEIYKSL